MATFPTSTSGGVALPVSIVNGGTGSATAADARTALGVVQGTLGANTYPSFFTKAGAQYTQLVDVRATTFVVRAAATLLPAQFWIYAETSFTNESNNVRLNGNNATGVTAGVTIGALGTIQTTGVLGATGRTTPSSAGAAGTGGTNATGGAGGAGGTGGGVNTGGAGGVGTAILATSQGLGTSIYRITHRIMVSAGSLNSTNGGAGGGSGGLTLNLGTGTSGGGGGGASAIRINARSFTNSGTISCNGGNGGDGIVTLAGAVCGGGGGGGGGFIGILADTYTNTGTVSCLGGLGGTGAGAGAGNGVAGSAGRVSIMTPTGTTNL